MSLLCGAYRNISHLMWDVKRNGEVAPRRRCASAEKILATDFIRQQFRLKKAYHAFVRVLARMFRQTDAFLPYLVQMQTVI